MHLFAPSLAFVDLETTGMRAAEDRVTEVGIVRVDAATDGGPPRVSEWSTLVNPGEPIPAVIQALTGITDAMVRDAPGVPGYRVGDRGTHRRLRVRRPQRALRPWLPEARIRARSAGRSRRGRCAR